MIPSNIKRIFDFAVKCDIPPKVAVVLPSVFEVAAKKCNTTRDELLERAMADVDVGQV